MKEYSISNAIYELTVSEHGAEIRSLKKNGKELMWQADPKFWGRTSPVLFPLVGNYWEKKSRHDGKVYEMSQHGFARDMDFKFVKQNNAEILFRLESSKATRELYPYKFTLEVSYKLKGYTLETHWKVINNDDKTMHFQIGGHPAFMCPVKNKGEQKDYYLVFNTDKPLNYSLLGEGGVVAKEGNVLKTEDGMIRIDEHLFDNDALIFESQGVNRISLCTPDKMTYVSVSFDTPLFGLWSPAGKNAPFVCIEPWYGRADKADFSGTIEERDFDNALQPGEVFDGGYKVEYL